MCKRSEKANVIMIRSCFVLLLLGQFISCSSLDRSTSIPFKSKAISFNPPADEFKFSERLLLDKIPLTIIRKHKIKSVTQERVSIDGGKENVIFSFIEKFDENGHKIYEQWSAWNGGPNYKYESDGDNKLLSVALIDSTDNMLGEIKYTYDKQGKLRKIGDYKLEYYANGLVKSIEDKSEIEKYKYDENGNLVHINFNLLPGTVACGNRITEWKGEYNNQNQLIKEYRIGFPDHITNDIHYSETGTIVYMNTTSNFDNHTHVDYRYREGILTERKTSDKKGKLLFIERYTYETY
ncbi:hypothetical protein [Xanthocytophaga agilis]|uniref:Uncharacterized protein n=1 Tax=Xanthocytophaga agilis TaxID=3048010 RepID=A0AAE3R809_9BACT|nr:hypothetical protein [Xanthocytophaga agilis]MDJ1503095.1 hypothetical protein [Xanthocytophaga agilis]